MTDRPAAVVRRTSPVAQVLIAAAGAVLAAIIVTAGVLLLQRVGADDIAAAAQQASAGSIPVVLPVESSQENGKPAFVRGQARVSSGDGFAREIRVLRGGAFIESLRIGTDCRPGSLVEAHLREPIAELRIVPNSLTVSGNQAAWEPVRVSGSGVAIALTCPDDGRLSTRVSWKTRVKGVAALGVHLVSTGHIRSSGTTTAAAPLRLIVAPR